MSFGGHESDWNRGGGGKSDFSTGNSGGGAGQAGFQGGGADGGQSQQQQARYKFTQEELRAIKECNRESFYYRCLPIGTVLGCGAYYGVRYGYLKPSARFGAGPKMFIGSIVGYFLGKFSYQKHCAEKLMAIPNSALGEMLRKQKGRMGFQETLSMEPGFATVAPVGGPAFSNSEFDQARTHSDVGDTRPMTSFDNESSSVGGYNDNHQSNANYDTTQQMLDDENLPPKRPQFVTSYDDLRRQNRIDYETKQHAPQGSSPDSMQNKPSGGSFEGRRNQPSYPNASDPSGKPRNKYGDVWDDKPSSY